MSINRKICNNLGSPISGPDLILDLLAASESHELPVAVMRRAAAIFGLSEQSVRIALTRLVRQGKITNTARGVYALDAVGNSLFHDVEHWLDKEQRAVTWHGGWVGVFDAAVPKSRRVAWRRHERALHLRGFRCLDDGLRLRPDNLAGGVAVLRDELAGLGLAPAARVLEVGGLSEAGQSEAYRLWDVAGMRRTYRDLLARLAESSARLDRLPPARAAAETLILGRTVIRHIVHDPLLPEGMLAGGERADLIACMRDYQQRGMEIWRAVLSD